MNITALLYKTILKFLQILKIELQGNEFHQNLYTS